MFLIFFLFWLICFIEFLRGKGKGKGIFGLYVAKSPLGVLLFFDILSCEVFCFLFCFSFFFSSHSVVRRRRLYDY